MAETKTSRLTRQDIQTWCNYWNAHGMVAIDRIQAFDQVAIARKFCRCMSVGVFSDVTDLQIWNALRAMRAEIALAA